MNLCGRRVWQLPAVLSGSDPAYVEKSAEVLVGDVAENRNGRANFGGSFPY